MSAPTDDMAAAFAAEQAEMGRQAAAFACRLAIVLVPCFGFLDAVAFPTHLGAFLALRAVCAAAMATILWLLGRTARPELLALGLATIILLMIDAMVAVTGGAASPYYAGLSLVIFAVTVLMPWHPGWTLAASAIALASFLVAVAVAGPVEDSTLLVNDLFFVVTTGGIAAAGSHLAGRLRWREFVQRSELEVALRHRSDFMAKMSHELRTPLHAVIGYADMLLDAEPAADEARRLVDRIRSRGVFLHRLISDLLDYSKAEAGKMAVRRNPIDVGRVVEQTVASFRPLFEQKTIVLDVRVDDDVPTIASDGHRLEQVVTNLLGNALKFTESGTVLVEARVVPQLAPEFVVLGGAVRLGPAIAVLVTDTGVGIDARDLGRLADDFQQLDGVAERYGGTGLGLAIARKLADLLGGQLVARSRAGVGSTFGVLLPCPPAPARHALAA
jgi:signal transduction histidine kinase